MACSEDFIAVFDSGLGGISVLRELIQQMPSENFLYFGDSANAPYGSKKTIEVRDLTIKCIEKLMTRGLKAVVIACNTATTAAIDILRDRYPNTIIVGIEPALKLAAESHPGGRIIVMATEVTLREEKFNRLMQQYWTSNDIVKLPSPKLVEFVEKGQFDGYEIEKYLMSILKPCLSPNTQAIVLGCTHFPFLRKKIEEIVGPQIAIYDGGKGVAAHTKHLLECNNLLRQDVIGSVIIENSINTSEIMELSYQLLRLDMTF